MKKQFYNVEERGDRVLTTIYVVPQPRLSDRVRQATCRTVDIVYIIMDRVAPFPII